MVIFLTKIIKKLLNKCAIFSLINDKILANRQHWHFEGSNKFYWWKIKYVYIQFPFIQKKKTTHIYVSVLKHSKIYKLLNFSLHIFNMIGPLGNWTEVSTLIIMGGSRGVWSHWNQSCMRWTWNPDIYGRFIRFDLWT